MPYYCCNTVAWC